MFKFMVDFFNRNKSREYQYEVEPKFRAVINNREGILLSDRVLSETELIGVLIRLGVGKDKKVRVALVVITLFLLCVENNTSVETEGVYVDIDVNLKVTLLDRGIKSGDGGDEERLKLLEEMYDRDKKYLVTNDVNVIIN